MAITLLDNETSTGSPVEIVGAQYLFRIESAGWNGATAELQIEGPNGTYIPVPDVSFTANGVVRVFLAGGLNAKVVITDATPSSGVYADLIAFGV